MRRIHFVTVAFWIYLIFWTVLLLLPDPAPLLRFPARPPSEFAYSPVPLDKLAHGGGYFLFMLLAAAALNSQPAAVGIAWLAAGASFHGAMTELMQLAIRSRDSNWGDFVSDLVGVALGTLVWRLFRYSPARETRDEQPS